MQASETYEQAKSIQPQLGHLLCSRGTRLHFPNGWHLQSFSIGSAGSCPKILSAVCGYVSASVVTVGDWHGHSDLGVSGGSAAGDRFSNSLGSNRAWLCADHRDLRAPPQGAALPVSRTRHSSSSFVTFRPAFASRRRPNLTRRFVCKTSQKQVKSGKRARLTCGCLC